MINAVMQYFNIAIAVVGDLSKRVSLAEVRAG
jgi:hypothetical protein